MPRWFVRLKMVIHPSTNGAQHRVTGSLLLQQTIKQTVSLTSDISSTCRQLSHTWRRLQLTCDGQIRGRYQSRPYQHLLTQPPSSTQPPTLSRTGNEHQPVRYGSFHLWTDVWVAGKTVSSSYHTWAPRDEYTCTQSDACQHGLPTSTKYLLSGVSFSLTAIKALYVTALNRSVFVYLTVVSTRREPDI